MPFGNLKVGDLIYESSGSEVTVSLASLVTNNSPAFTGTATGVNLTLSGNLTVNGTQTIINTQTLDVEDKQIEIGKVASPSDTTADQGGWKLKGATDKTFLWLNATDSWTSSEHIEIASGKNFKVDGTTFFVDGTNDRVGIGLTAPQRTLHLSSNNTVFALTDTAASTDQKTKYMLSDAGLLAFGKLTDDYGTAVQHLGIDNDGNATFAGNITTSNGSLGISTQATGNPVENDTPTLAFFGAADDTTTSARIQAKFIGTQSGSSNPTELNFYTKPASLGPGSNPLLALTLDKDQNATFASDISVSGGSINLGVADSASGHINAFEAMTFNIDTDNDDTNRTFKFCTGGSDGSGTTLLTIAETGNATYAGTVSDSKGDLRSIPTKLEANAYTLVAADAGKCVSCDNGCTVPNNVFAAGDIVTIINSATSDKTITQGSGLTMRNVGDDGNYGNVTVKKYAMSTIIFTHPTVCFFSTTAAA